MAPSEPNRQPPYRPDPERVLNISDREIRKAADTLVGGGVVAFPTETVYGLGARTDNPEAIQHVFDLKGRPSDNPLIVHLSNREQVPLFARVETEGLDTLLDQFWPGPLTVVLPRQPNVLDLVTGGLDTVALRMPAHPVAQALIEQSGPLVAPSANRSGRPSPTAAAHVREDFGDQLFILDGGPCDIGLESTVLDLHQEPWTLLRPGYYSRETLETTTGRSIQASDGSTRTPRSPGMKYTHYKPDAEVRWYQSGDNTSDPDQTLFITHGDKIPSVPHQYYMDGDFERMARQLYDLFRSADAHGLANIRIEPLPKTFCHPILPALENRIKKAIGR
ncbi:MAG: L-threonylcarbamoyladenylate synthase [Balneolaceae bacterium]